LIINYLWTTLPSVDLNVLVLLFIIKRNLSLTNTKHNFYGFHWFIIWFFLAPLTDLNTNFFIKAFVLVHCIAPNYSTFQGWSKSVYHFCQGFWKINWCSFCLKIFLVLESTHTFQRSCLFKSNCWNKIKEILFFKTIFWKSSLFGQKPNTLHLIHVALWLSFILKIEIDPL